jgi:hypothetical protein
VIASFRFFFLAPSASWLSHASEQFGVIDYAARHVVGAGIERAQHLGRLVRRADPQHAHSGVHLWSKRAFTHITRAPSMGTNGHKRRFWGFYSRVPLRKADSKPAI